MKTFFLIVCVLGSSFSYSKSMKVEVQCEVSGTSKGTLDFPTGPEEWQIQAADYRLFCGLFPLNPVVKLFFGDQTYIGKIQETNVRKPVAYYDVECTDVQVEQQRDFFYSAAIPVKLSNVESENYFFFFIGSDPQTQFKEFYLRTDSEECQIFLND